MSAVPVKLTSSSRWERKYVSRNFEDLIEVYDKAHPKAQRPNRNQADRALNTNLTHSKHVVYDVVRD